MEIVVTLFFLFVLVLLHGLTWLIDERYKLLERRIEQMELQIDGTEGEIE